MQYNQNEKGKVLFTLRFYNDIDHMAPVMWHLLEKGYAVDAVLVNAYYDLHKDVRINFLKKYKKFNAKYYYNIRLPLLKLRFVSRIKLKVLMNFFDFIFKIINKIFYTDTWAYAYIKNMNPISCIFDYGNTTGPIKGKIFQVCQKLNIPVYCLPHGLCAIMNKDMNDNIRKFSKKPDFTPRNAYAGYVFQSSFQKDIFIDWGLNSSICKILGSARFYPKWQQLYKDLFTRYETLKNDKDKIKVVFMLSNWKYNIAKRGTLELINILADRKDIYLIIKAHSRAKSGKLNNEFIKKIENKNNVEYVKDDISSISLIKWADVVVNMVSSIGIEVVMQRKVMIMPEYLCDNHTIFQETNTCELAHSTADVLDIIYKYAISKKAPSLTEENIDKLMNLIVYGSGHKRDVLEEYSSLILNKK